MLTVEVSGFYTFLGSVDFYSPANSVVPFKSHYRYVTQHFRCFTWAGLFGLVNPSPAGDKIPPTDLLLEDSPCLLSLYGGSGTCPHGTLEHTHL